MQSRRSVVAAMKVANGSLKVAIRAALGARPVLPLFSAVGALLSGPQVMAAEPEAIEQIGVMVVTAQKRTESLQEIPYNISAVASDALTSAGMLSINNLTQLVPGLMTVDQGPAARGGNNNFVLRGLRSDTPGGGATGALYHNVSQSPVSTYFGEVPVFFQAPLDDIERVEVLRGPQGTLYGSGAQAGTIRFIPRRPEFDRASGEVSAEGSWTEHSTKANGRVSGIWNVPLADTLALRVVAGESHVGGFIDATNRIVREANGAPVSSIPGDLTSGFVLGPIEKDVNASDQWYGRAALRWQPSDSIDVQLDYLHQRTSMDDSQWSSDWGGGSFDTSVGLYPDATIATRPGCDFCTSNWLAEPYESTIDLVDLVASVDVGLGTITSATAYYDNPQRMTTDQTGIFYGDPTIPSPEGSLYIPNFPYYGYPRLTVPSVVHTAARAFVQELRFVSNPGTIVDYVVGLYYHHQIDTEKLDQSIPGLTPYLDAINNPNPFNAVDLLYHRDAKTTFYDRAVFGELTFHLTPQWQMTGGLRVFRQTDSISVDAQAPLCGIFCTPTLDDPSGSFGTDESHSYTKHVAKFNTAYDFSDSLKVYATYSEGFRHGGASGFQDFGPFASYPGLQRFEPDVSKNIEIGVKGSLFGHRVSYFADVYRMDTEDFQMNVSNLAGVYGVVNGSESRAEGVELQLDALVTNQFRVGLGYAYTDSKVLETFDVLDYVPYALPEFGGNLETVSLFGGPIAAGTALPGVSEHTANGLLEYTIPAGNWEWRLHLDGSYRSSQKSALVPGSFYGFVIPSVWLANASITLTDDGPWRYQLFVRNIGDEPDISGGVFDQLFANPYRLRNAGMPRTIGLGLTYQF